jgi:hypothetical protein
VRGAKVDRTATKALRDNHLFLDRRSFISIDAHLYLKGDDVICQRQRVWHRSKGKCKNCKAQLSPLDAELDHKQGGLVGRCDCLHNLQILCHDCHVKKHGRFPRFGEGRAKANRGI